MPAIIQPSIDDDLFFQLSVLLPVTRELLRHLPCARLLAVKDYQCLKIFPDLGKTMVAIGALSEYLGSAGVVLFTTIWAIYSFHG